MAKKTSPQKTLARPVLNDERKWQAEDDVRTLTRAAEIKGDRRRLARAQKEVDHQQKALEKAKKS